MAAIPLEIGADLDRESLVQDVALHMTGRGQRDLARADAAFHAAAHDDFLGIDVADDDRLFADDEPAGADVAIHSAVDLHVTGREQRPSDDKVRADDRRRAVAKPALWRYRRGRCRRR